jgi:cyclic pyranopterin phosphate synthase
MPRWSGMTLLPSRKFWWFSQNDRRINGLLLTMPNRWCRTSRLIRARLSGRHTLVDLDDRTGGPARYVRVKEIGGRLGFITPLTHYFCESCNRVRLTCTGQLFMCLGQEDAADLRAPVRASESNELLERAIVDAIARKPKGHDFIIDRRHDRPAVGRHMSMTGG